MQEPQYDITKLSLNYGNNRYNQFELDAESNVVDRGQERDIYEPERGWCTCIRWPTLVFCLVVAPATFFLFQAPDSRNAAFLVPTAFPSQGSPAITPTDHPIPQPTIDQDTATPTGVPNFKTTTAPTETTIGVSSAPTKAPSVLPIILTPTITPTTIRPTSSPTIASPTSTPTTLTPTFSLSVSPTLTPTLSSYISTPTVSPTISTTSRIVSRLDCTAIQLSRETQEGNFGERNFKVVEINGKLFCGDTYGPDAARPNRNVWSPKVGRRNCPLYSYAEGEAICDSVGARQCTVEEFILGVGHGTGCGGDSEFIYTLSDCYQNSTGVSGKIMLNVGLSTPRSYALECVSDINVTSIVRCCGDMEIEDNPSG